MKTEPDFGFRQLDVYRCSIQWVARAEQIASGFPRGQGPLADQLRRAAMSIALNIAEAVGRTSDPDRQRHFGIARGSATECAAILDVAVALEIAAPTTAHEGTALLVRIVQMLTRLCR